MEDGMNLEEVEKRVVRSELANLRAKYLGDDGSRVFSIQHRLGVRNNEYGESSGYRQGRTFVRFSSNNRRSSRDRSGGRMQRTDNTYSRDRYNNNGRDRYNNGYNNRRPDMRPDHSQLTCNYCKRLGHIKRNCRLLKGSQGSQGSQAINLVEEENLDKVDGTYDFKRLKIDSKDSDSDEEIYPCMMIGTINHINEPCLVNALIGNHRLQMEIDCGAAVSVMSGCTYSTTFSHLKVLPCKSKLVVVNGEALDILGKIFVNVWLNNKEQQVSFIILNSKHNFTPLVRRNWLDIFYTGWRQVFSKPLLVNNIDGAAGTTRYDPGSIKVMFPNVFKKDLSQPIIGHEANLTLKKEAPIFRKAYDVPYRLRDKVLKHMEHLEEQRIITPIDVSEWASPVVIVLKKDGDIRMTHDECSSEPDQDNEETRGKHYDPSGPSE
ncbi:uncharacterized protein K02A2.6-like [Aedes albopictus]|uniref:CCHC-type domain-containing protein n=1 Tax=Aedes albopictus TaxID=7160 RepID=A0ABM1Y527_AEDAL